MSKNSLSGSGARVSAPKVKNAIDAGRHNLPTIGKLIAKANRDTDAASVFILGNNLDDCQGALIIIKGNTETLQARLGLARDRLLTLGKPVESGVAS